MIPDMKLQAALDGRTKVEDFQRTHHVELMTMLFTDIVGSTELKQRLGDRHAIELLHRHHAAVRATLAGFPNAAEIDTAGDGFFIVFTKPSDAVRFALLLQTRLRALAIETGHPILDRIGIHAGEVFVEERTDSGKPRDFYGIQVDTTARVMSLGAGDQVLMTRFVFDNARQILRGQDITGLDSLTWLNHGLYAMKGVEEPLEICEAGETGKARLFQPADSDKAKRHGVDADAVLGWRPAVGLTVPNTQWTLERLLGEGGFGEVWLGRHETLKERCVFKFCFRADRVRSLKREMTLFRVMKERIGEHPNIVRVRDAYLDEPPFYLIMDYADGENLGLWIAQRGGFEKVPVKERLRVVAQAAEALQAAHDAGVMHRDIKPSNIIVAGDGTGELRVRLTDFGIGQVVSDQALAGVTRLGFTMTMMGTESAGTGTQMYMPPELTAGKPATPAADVYSLGIVLYQLLIGDFTRPFTTDWAGEVTDPLLREDLARCFAGKPHERMPAGQLAHHLLALDERGAELLRKEKAAALAVQKAATKERLKGSLLLLIFPVLASLLLAWVSRDREDGDKVDVALITFVACVVTMLIGYAEVVLSPSFKNPEGSARSVAMRELIRLFLRLLLMTGVSALLFFAIVRITAPVDGSVAWQLSGLLGLAWSTAGLSIAGHAIFRSQAGMIMFFLVLAVTQIFTGGYMIPPTSMTRSVFAVSRLTPAFSAQTMMDTSFLWMQAAKGNILSDHHQAFRNLDPDHEITTGEIYNRSTLLPLLVQFLWGLTGLGLGCFAWLRKSK